MKCPVDGTALVMTERSGVEIDYCPQCRGVWLDRGELDKIIDRAAPEAPPREVRSQDFMGNRSVERRDDDRRRGYRDEDDDGYRKKKRGGLLGDIFDF